MERNAPMKKIKRITVVTILIAALLGSSVSSFAFSENESRSVENFFIEAQLLKGDGSGYGLDKPTTRMEGIIILIRLLGEEAEAQKLQASPCRFLDVPNWAAGYANYADERGISKGVSADRFGTNDLMTAQQFHTLLLRVIGYDDASGDFRWDNAVDKAENLGILSRELADRYEDHYTYMKRDLIETSFSFLMAQYKDGDATLIGNLVDSGVISYELAEEYGLVVEGWDSISTNLSEDESYTFELEDNVLTITGRSDDEDKQWLLALISNKETGAEKTEKTFKRDSDGEYEFSISVNNLPKGEYFVDLYANDEKYNRYTSFILSSLILKVTSGDSYFVPAPIYGENLRFFKGNQVDARDEFMTLMTRADRNAIDRIKELSAEITKDCGTDYEKILAIHDWVADYVYYDKDFLTGKKDSTNLSSISVLDNRYAVCSGYSSLTKDLITAAGIPCKLIVGYALGIDSDEDDWGDVNLRRLEPNHAWNEAYADGRWIILDTTWDSSNTYEGGSFDKGDGVSHIYFDSTLKFYSNSHKTMDYVLY